MGSSRSRPSRRILNSVEQKVPETVESDLDVTCTNKQKIPVPEQLAEDAHEQDEHTLYTAEYKVFSGPRILVVIAGYLRRIQRELQQTLIIPVDISVLCYQWYTSIRIHGELFDLLYYTTKLDEKIVRTYFRYLVEQMERIHASVKQHEYIGQLVPQYIFLTEDLSIDILYYPLTANDSTSDAYKAPEVISNDESIIYIDEKADVFSMGVILYVMLCAQLPFDCALDDDAKIVPDTRNSSITDLLRSMLALDPKQRIGIEQIKQHRWYNLPVCWNGDELIESLRQNFVKVEEQRKVDLYREYQNRQSTDPWNIRHYADYELRAAIEPFPVSVKEGLFDTYTHFEATVPESEIDAYSQLQGWIEDILHGDCRFDFDSNVLYCCVRIKHPELIDPRWKHRKKKKRNKHKKRMEFGIKLYRSTEWNVRKYQFEDVAQQKDDETEFDVDELENVYVIRIFRIKGDPVVFLRAKNYMLKYCFQAMKGLPLWSRAILKRQYQLKQ